MTSTVISIRIPRELKERLERLKINVSEVVRRLLERYMEELETRELEEQLRELRIRLSGRIDPATMAELIRGDRVER